MHHLNLQKLLCGNSQSVAIFKSSYSGAILHTITKQHACKHNDKEQVRDDYEGTKGSGSKLTTFHESNDYLISKKAKQEGKKAIWKLAGDEYELYVNGVV